MEDSDAPDGLRIWCKSKSRSGRFYMLNKDTGETKWCVEEKPVSPGSDCEEIRVKENSPPRLRIAKKSKTPAQDRLKRLQMNLKTQKEKSVKTPQLVQTSNSHNNVNGLNIDLKLFDAKTTEPKQKSDSNQKEAAERKAQLPTQSSQNKSPEKRKNESKCTTVPPAKCSRKRPFPLDKSVTSSKAKIPTSEVTTLAYPDKCDEDLKATTTSLTQHGTAKARNEGVGDNFKSQTTEATNSKTGIFNKIKEICKTTIKIVSKTKDSGSRTKTKPTIKAHKTKANTGVTSISPQSVLLACQNIKGNFRGEQEEWSERSGEAASSSVRSSKPWLPPKPAAISESPAWGTTKPNSFFASYPRNSANLRLERLRQVLQNQHSTRAGLVNERSASPVTAAASPVSPSSTTIDDSEPMDWQPIESEESLVQSNNNKPTKVAPSSRAIVATAGRAVNEYFDVVNENLLRFSAERSKRTGAAQQWLPDHFYFVVDTNVLLNTLTFLDDLLEMKLCDTNGTVIYIPYLVLQELDKLKMRASKEGTKALAACAIKHLNIMFKTRSKYIRAQSASEERYHIIDVSSPDDSILNCCLQAKQHVENVLLLTEDVNLSNKAMCSNVLVSSKSDLISLSPSAYSTWKEPPFQ